MTWTWQFEKADGSRRRLAARLPKETFRSQGDAESWLGENWRGLLEAASTRSACSRTAARVRPDEPAPGRRSNRRRPRPAG